MSVLSKDTTVMEWLAVFVGVSLMAMLAFTTLAPYVCAWSVTKCTIPSDLIRQIDQTQNTIQNLSLILFGFLFGASVGSRAKDKTIAELSVPSDAATTVTTSAPTTTTVTTGDPP